jgi:hypothetical protein
MKSNASAFGRGFIKLLVSLFGGTGAGFLVVGITYARPEYWTIDQRGGAEPTTGLVMLGLGAGLVATAALLILLFVVPWLLAGGRETPRETAREGAFPDRIN